MLRFLRERRAWLAAAFVALILVIGLWVWGVPRAAARVAGAFGDRFGVEVDIEDTSVRFRTVEMRGVEVRGRHGGLLVRVDELDAKMSLIGALFDGAGSVRGLSARGVDATIDLEHEDVDELAAELRRRMTSKSSDSSANASSKPRRSGGRAYEVSDLTIRVADAVGPLLFMRDLSFVKEADVLRSQVEETMVGARGADHAHI